ncbi:FAD/NAD(P)-binding domain-containing protein [Mycena venus]|uniref:FAD/NAD(P)-binding domain-containing protein n=1 Tax=Mycena venus TaxID=2733690 RepID=A0A8H7CPL8_9AGAR|nr:FAD/NAD(P)-binding domain-containing protein [Mycena venus]
MTAPLGPTLRIAITGAGMGGLATALALARQGFTQIDVYEAARDLGFVGAGIQIAPNLSRQLQQLGAWETHMAPDAVEMDNVSIRGGNTDEELVRLDVTHILERYGQPHRVAHRAALANALYEACKAVAPRIRFHFGTSVINVDFDTPRLCIRAWGEEGDGRWINADVVIGADGVKSVVRKCMLARHGEEDDAEDTGQAAYRIMLRRDQLAHDPELLSLLESNTTTRWIGAGRQIIAYPISNHTILNIATTQPDANFAAEPSATWTTRADKSAMLQVYADFCPRVVSLLRLVPTGDVCEWKLRVHRPLRTWVEGSVTLVGDACHPTLPHLGQGAAQAIEDGVVLAFMMGKLVNIKELNTGLLVFERLRKARTEFLVDEAAASGRALLLADPEAQAARDAAFQRVKEGGPNPDKWVDRAVTDYLYGFDCIADAEARYRECVVKVMS